MGSGGKKNESFSFELSLKIEWKTQARGTCVASVVRDGHEPRELRRPIRNSRVQRSRAFVSAQASSLSDVWHLFESVLKSHGRIGNLSSRGRTLLESRDSFTRHFFLQIHKESRPGLSFAGEFWLALGEQPVTPLKRAEDDPQRAPASFERERERELESVL